MGGNPMDNHFNKKQIEKAKKLVDSPQGKQLVNALLTANPELMNKASSALHSNDYSLLAATLAPLLESDSVKQLLQQFGD